MIEGHAVTLGGREFSLGLSFRTLDALARVLVTPKGGKPGELVGFCPFKTLRGDLDPSFAEVCAVLAMAASHGGKVVRAEDIAKMRPGSTAVSSVVVNYCVALMQEFSPEDARAPKGPE